MIKQKYNMDLSALHGIKNKFNFTPNTILDIGASNGWFTNLCKTVWPAASFTMIEANPFFENALKSMGIHYIIALLGDKEKSSVKFYINKTERGSTGNSIYREISEFFNDKNCEIIYLPMNILDNLVTDTYDLIKIDTQGSELDIIKGGINTIKKSKYLLLEVSLKSCNEGAPLKDEVVNYLKYINFIVVDSPYSHYLNGELLQEDLIFKNKSYDNILQIK